MEGFHPLVVAAVDRLTDQAVAVTFELPAGLAEAFAFTPGQHLTLRQVLDGVDLRRTYSLCGPVGGPLRIGVKRLEGGAFSGWVVDHLRVGDVVEVAVPAGRFGAVVSSGRVGLLAAGSGITPILSIAATALGLGAEVVLVYGNRSTRDVMFLEELSDLKDRYATHLQLLHMMSREEQESELLSGRLDAERLGRLLDTVLPPVDSWYLCGPFGMVTACRDLLASRGAEAHVELFFAEAAPPRPPGPPGETTLVAVLNGRSSTLTMDRDEHVLDAVLAVRPDAPFACRGGVCGTCRARVVDGTVDMDVNWALEADELAAGVVLTCQSRPTSPELHVEYL